MSYANTAIKGPAIIVLPGEVKSNNATFTQRYFPNNIADYAELELSQANFQVLDRANLGSVLREIELAYNLGDPKKAQTLFQKGELQNTRWIVKFDVLRAEKVAGEEGAARTVYREKPTPGKDLLTPGSSPTFAGVRSDSFWKKLDFLSLMIALFAGTASLPHILIRYYTVKDQASARKSTSG